MFSLMLKKVAHKGGAQSAMKGVIFSKATMRGYAEDHYILRTNASLYELLEKADIGGGNKAPFTSCKISASMSQIRCYSDEGKKFTKETTVEAAKEIRIVKNMFKTFEHELYAMDYKDLYKTLGELANGIRALERKFNAVGLYSEDIPALKNKIIGMEQKIYASDSTSKDLYETCREIGDKIHALGRDVIPSNDKPEICPFPTSKQN